MTLSEFKSKLNWRLILVHLWAFWFIAYAFGILSEFYDLPFFKAVIQGQDLKHIGWERIYHFTLWTTLSSDTGLLISFIVSLVIDRYRRWYWLNSLLAFLLAFILWRFKFPWHQLKNILLTPGSLVHNLAWELIINGSLLLVIGLLLLFLTRIARFINGPIKEVEPGLGDLND